VLVSVFYWGGAQVSWLRLGLSIAAEVLLIGYLAWAARILRR
jgi:hypothetical protein